MKTKSIQFCVDPFYHLLPIINLARTAMIAERTLRDLEAVRRLYPEVDQTLALTGVNVLDDESLTEHAAHALEFVADVIRHGHEQDMEGFVNDL